MEYLSGKTTLNCFLSISNGKQLGAIPIFKSYSFSKGLLQPMILQEQNCFSFRNGGNKKAGVPVTLNYICELTVPKNFFSFDFINYKRFCFSNHIIDVTLLENTVCH